MDIAESGQEKVVAGDWYHVEPHSVVVLISKASSISLQEW
jgi:hypothetical protein